LGVSPGAVSLRHQAAGWALYREARAALPSGLHLVIDTYVDEPDPKDRP
jgi:hypothetical protein